MVRLLTLAVIFGIALPSCAKLGLGKKEKEPQPFGPTGIPPQLRASEPGGTSVAPGGNVTMGPAITPEDEIVFTDPDNPEAGLPELSTLLATPKKGPWEESETIARRRASREGKPLLIWFTDSKTSPMCKALSQELFSRSDFGDWATEKIVRLRVDASSSVERESLDEQRDVNVRRENYSAAIKKRYKVLGHPTLLMLNTGGEVVGRYRGYKRGEADFTWGLIKQGEFVAGIANKEWRAGLEKKGYREWQDTKGRKVFAKLANYHQGELILIEPDGTRSKTGEERLSDADRTWIAKEKAARGIKP